jgi:hypothetical protein
LRPHPKDLAGRLERIERARRSTDLWNGEAAPLDDEDEPPPFWFRPVSDFALCPIMRVGSITARQFVGATALGVEVAPVAS